MQSHGKRFGHHDENGGIIKNNFLGVAFGDRHDHLLSDVMIDSILDLNFYRGKYNRYF